MILLEIVRFALRALVGHRLRSLLSLTGVAIGVAAVIVLTALGEGARTYVIGEFASIGTNLLLILPGKTETTGGFPGVGGVPQDLTIADAEALARRMRTARSVAPMAMATDTVSHGERRRQLAVIGVTAEFLEVRHLVMARGEFIPKGDWSRGQPLAVLGATSARELFPGTDPVGQVIRIGEARARVQGVLAPRGTQLGVDMDDVVLLPVVTAMRLFNRSSLFRVLVEVRAHSDLPAAKREALAILADRHGEEDVTALTQDAVVSSFSAILNALTLALAAIAAISLSVAGIGIMNVMLVSVAERTSEVGLLKAVGVARRQILAVFMAEAALLSLAGGLVGLAVGWSGVRLLIGIFPALPARAPTWAVVASLLVSALVGIVFGLLPARRATRLDPIAALARR